MDYKGNMVITQLFTHVLHVKGRVLGLAKNFISFFLYDGSSST